jgi:hypothetical protein
MEISILKLIFAVMATVAMLAGYYPYLKDLFARKTQPHLYTWLIWAITASIATAGVIVGGGNLGAIPMVIGTALVVFVCLLSFKYGSKNITKSDTLTLIAALIAVLVWVQLDNPLLAVVLATVIDGFGYIPTYRKSYQEPWSETTFFWIAMSANSFLAIAALENYSLLTSLYLFVLGVANFGLFVLLIHRRKSITK